MSRHEESWKYILSGLNQPIVYQGLRKNIDSGEFWIDPAVSGLSADECRKKIAEADLRDQAAADFASKNPVLAILPVRMVPVGADIADTGG